jgi:steroid 5-alpha reductase family enzyme
MSVNVGEVFSASVASVAALMLCVWLVSVIIRDASIVDIGWGFGFVVIAWVTFFVTEGDQTRKLLIVSLTSVWGLRLAAYLAWRNLGKGEDYRYQAMRERHGRAFAWKSLYRVFLLQGVVMWVVSLPVQAGQLPSAGLWWLDGVGVAVYAVGLFFEALGDHQLARFKANPANAGLVMNQGLGRYTRHPNYFGDSMVWWGLYVIALAGGAWWSIVGPLVMSLFLLRISGVTLLERSLKQRREGYNDYMRQTSAFFPLPPRVP